MIRAHLELDAECPRFPHICLSRFHQAIGEPYALAPSPASLANPPEQFSAGGKYGSHIGLPFRTKVLGLNHHKHSTRTNEMSSQSNLPFPLFSLSMAASKHSVLATTTSGYRGLQKLCNCTSQAFHTGLCDRWFLSIQQRRVSGSAVLSVEVSTQARLTSCSFPK
jgi:hypothetical protein